MKKYNKNKDLKKEQTGGTSVANSVLGSGGANLYSRARGVFTGNPTFQGGPYGFGGEGQLAAPLNQATKKIQDQEQEELDQNVTDQIWSLGKYIVGSGPNKFVDFTTGRDAIPTTVTEQSPIDNSTSRMRDLPGFPKMDSLVNKKRFVPPEEENRDKVYLGPTLDNVPLQELINKIAEEVIQELLGNPRATYPSRQGWNNKQINSLSNQKNHLHPGEDPPPSWRPMFKDPIDPYEAQGIPPADKSPMGTMGVVGWPKKFVPDDYEQNPDHEAVIDDPLSSRRLQSPPKNNMPRSGGAPSISETSMNNKKSVYPKKNNKLNNTTGDLNLDGKGPDAGAEAFETSRKEALKEFINQIVQEVTLPTIQTDVPVSANKDKTTNDFTRRNTIPFDPHGDTHFTPDTITHLTKQELEMQQKHLDNLAAERDKEMDARLANKSVGRKTKPTVPVKVPQQPLSSKFNAAVTDLVKQLNDSPLKQQEKDKLAATIWKINLDPKKSEDEKLKSIQTYVKQKIGDHPVDFGKIPNTPAVKTSFTDKLKKRFGLSESESKLLTNILFEGK